VVFAVQARFAAPSLKKFVAPSALGALRRMSSSAEDLPMTAKVLAGTIAHGAQADSFEILADCAITEDCGA